MDTFHLAWPHFTCHSHERCSSLFVMIMHTPRADLPGLHAYAQCSYIRHISFHSSILSFRVLCSLFFSFCFVLRFLFRLTSNDVMFFSRTKPFDTSYLLFLILFLFLLRAISTIKRKLTLKISVYPSFLLMLEFTNFHRKMHADFVSSLTSIQVWSQLV